MGVRTFEGIVEQGQIRLPAAVRLPERAKVFVVVPDIEEGAAYPISTPLHAFDAAATMLEVLGKPNTET